MSAWLSSRPQAPKILVVRNDGLGDFILTLPLVAALKRQLPGARIHVLVNRGLAGLVPLLPDVAGAVLDEGVLLKRHRGLLPAPEARARRAALLEEVRGHAFDLAVLPYAESGSAALVHRAGIPWRAGSGRRWFGWRFNLRNGATRRGSDWAEYELNLTYLETLGLENRYAAPAVKLPRAKAGGKRPYAVLHPHKRSGTALSWPLENFTALARGLAEAGLEVVAVGDAADAPVLNGAFPAGAGVRVETGLPLPQLAALLAGARLFVGNSSGPLHLAGLVGTPHVGFFPQNRVSAPARWRTLPMAGAPERHDTYLLASAFPKNCVRCELERCRFFNCVASIPQERVWAALDAWGVEQGRPPGLQAAGP